jgi:peptide/nickel transport system permease protein
MWRYIVRRLLWAVFVIMVITALTFLIFFVMPPTDPVVFFAGKQPTPEIIAEVKRQLGLDQPVYVQYWRWISRFFKGDEYGWPGLGFSYASRSSVRELLFHRIGRTLELAIGAAICWLCIGVPIGVISAIKRGTLVDRAAMLFALIFVSMPVFVLGQASLFFFWFRLHWLPGTGYKPLAAGFAAWYLQMLLPWLVLAMLFAAFYARMVRSNMLETMAQDYIRTARVKGLSESRVIIKHGLRASLTPVVTLLGVDLGGLIGGAVITETVFNIQGVGQWAVQSVFGGDVPAVLAVVFTTAVAVTILSLLVDIVYAYLDPRVRYT